MNVSRSRIDVKMHRVNIKTSKRLSESSESFEQSSFKLLKILLNLSSTSTAQILNEMNNLSSKCFESSRTTAFSSTNRIFNLYFTNATLKALEIFRTR